MAHDVGRELLAVPFPEMVFSLASAIAQSQTSLDLESIRIMKIMGDKKNYPVHLPKINVDGSGKLLDDDEGFITSMIGAGFQPTFYQFSETIIEVSMTINMTEDIVEKGTKVVGYQYTTQSYFFGLLRRIVCTPLNATYTNTFNYHVEGKSLLRTRLVPVPPNTYVQRILDMKASAIQASFELEMRKAELAIEQLKAAESAKIAAEENK